MESIVRNVKDIETDERQYLEQALGRQLVENQQVIIHVVDLDVEPNVEVRRDALAEASEIARRGRVHAAAQGVTEAEADAAIEEAINHVRRGSK